VRVLNQSSVAATEYKGAKKPEAADERASEHSAMNVDETVWKRRSESETVTEEANEFTTGCDVVAGKTSEVQQEADDSVDESDDEIRDHETTVVEHVAENADMLQMLSESKDRGNVELEEYGNEQTYEHVTADDIEPATVDATASVISSGSEGGKKAVDLQPLPDAVVDSMSATEQLPTADEEHDLEDAEARHIQTHDQKDDTGKQDSFRHSEEDYEGKEISCIGAEADVDEIGTNELAEDSSKPRSAETETGRLSKLEEEPSELGRKEQSCGVDDSEVETSNDDDKLESRTSEIEEDRIVKVKSSPGYREYVAAVKKIKERLKETTQTPEDNSVTNCLRFYTREEQMDEYFCLTCNQGEISC